MPGLILGVPPTNERRRYKAGHKPKSALNAVEKGIHVAPFTQMDQSYS